MPIRPDLPAAPESGEPLAAAHESPDTLRLLALRRSTPVTMLSQPGPSPDDLDMLLRLGLRAPDHRKLEPWRVLVIEGDARARLGEVYAKARATADPGASEAALAEARGLPMRAPAILCVISAPVRDDPKRTPVWEQHLSAGAVCQTLMIAANAAGWAAVWITEWPAFDANVQAALGVKPGEQIAGFLYLGTAREKPVERQRPNVAAKATRWTGVMLA